MISEDKDPGIAFIPDPIQENQITEDLEKIDFPIILEFYSFLNVLLADKRLKYQIINCYCIILHDLSSVKVKRYTFFDSARIL